MQVVEISKGFVQKEITLTFICPSTREEWVHKSKDWRKWAKVAKCAIELGIALAGVSTGNISSAGRDALSCVAEFKKAINGKGDEVSHFYVFFL
jgi:hypothetical protein